MGDIRRCVQSQLKRNPSLRASGALDLTIGTDGKVTAASFPDGKLKGTYLEACIKLESSAWRFPTSDESYGLTVPLNVVGSEDKK